MGQEGRAVLVKITLEDPQSGTTITIERSLEDASLSEIVEAFMRPLAKASGYSPATVDDVLGPLNEDAMDSLCARESWA